MYTYEHQNNLYIIYSYIAKSCVPQLQSITDVGKHSISTTTLVFHINVACQEHTLLLLKV